MKIHLHRVTSQESYYDWELRVRNKPSYRKKKKKLKSRTTILESLLKILENTSNYGKVKIQFFKTIS